MMPKIHIYQNLSELSRAMADDVSIYIRQVLAKKKLFNLVLSGGNTPKELYRELARKKNIPWAKVRFYWSDERYLPPDEPLSNYRMARETLLNHIGADDDNIFPMPTDFSNPGDAAAAYEMTLRTHFGDSSPDFDLLLLGLGADGHIASLFPNTPALQERDKWVVATESSVEPRQRLSLTLPAINSSSRIYFIVSGKEKAEPFRRAAQRIINIDDCPGCAVHARSGEPEWWVDKDATAALFKSR